MKFNPTIATDAYKVTHWLQRPEGLTKFYSYGEPRLGGQHDKICFFGLQYIIKEYFMRKVTQEDIDRGFKRSKSVFGNEYYFPKHIWEKVRDLGYFPLRIKAIKEGTILNTSNVCFTIEATEEWFADMVSHFEDWLMWQWYSTGVATRAFNIKTNIKKSFDESCDNPFLQFAVNDFGLRGATFNEGASVGGAAHLIFFDGSDNIPAMDFIEEYYTDDNIGQSVWACYDDQTEILSEEGWKLFKNLPKGIRVAQYEKDGTISFVVPSKYYDDIYEGDLIQFKRGEYIDLVVTPNHKMVVKKKDKVDWFESDKSNYNGHNHIIVAGEARQGTSLSLLEKLKIAFQADGSFPSHKEDYTGEKGKGFPIRFSLKREDKHNRLLDYCNELELQYSDTQYEDGYYSMWINVPEIFVKDFSWIKISEMSGNKAKEFIEELQYWDGTKSSKNTISYYSTNLECVDKLQEICAIAGYKSYFSSKDDKRTDSSRKTLYSLIITLSKNKVSGSNTVKENIKYSGHVYCVTVPSGMLVVRRNKKVVICGNTEHSVATVWGPGEGELEYIKAQLQRSAPEAIVSIVIDSYDADNFIKNVVGNPEVKQLIINKPGRVVLRPDSNDPLTNVCRYSEMLGNIFGYHINNKGYKVLNNNVGLIQGDGMNERTILEIYAEYIKTGWAAENFITGSGGGLLEEGLTRDTDRWAVKVSHVEINNQSVNVQKTPKSDLTKSSKAGKLILVENNAGTKKSNFSTYSSKDVKPTMFNSYIDSLETVYYNGQLMREQTFSEIRKIANSYV